MACDKFNVDDRVLTTGASSIKEEYRYRHGIIRQVHPASGVYTVELVWSHNKELVLHDDELESQCHDDLDL